MCEDSKNPYIAIRQAKTKARINAIEINAIEQPKKGCGSDTMTVKEIAETPKRELKQCLC